MQAEGKLPSLLVALKQSRRAGQREQRCPGRSGQPEAPPCLPPAGQDTAWEVTSHTIKTKKLTRAAGFSKNFCFTALCLSRGTAKQQLLKLITSWPPPPALQSASMQKMTMQAIQYSFLLNYGISECVHIAHNTTVLRKTLAQVREASQARWLIAAPCPDELALLCGNTRAHAAKSLPCLQPARTTPQADKETSKFKSGRKKSAQTTT